ncbi:MAG: helix-turn-helix domain-containing protein [Candidatus Micrarchaeota archaeon]
MAFEEEIESLTKLGFTKNEALAYLTLLRIGEATVSTIAQYSGIYRPYVYDTLKKLSEKGLVSFIIKDKVRLYNAAPPTEFLSWASSFDENVKKIMPKLTKIAGTSKDRSVVELFSGKKAVRAIMMDVIETLIRTGGEDLVMGVDEKKFMDADPIGLSKIFLLLKKHKLKERVLVREGDRFLPGKDYGTTEYRFLSSEFFSPTATFIYGDNVAFITFSEPFHGIIIRGKDLAEAYRRQFELLWKHAKK